MFGNWRPKCDTHPPSLPTYREAAEAGATGTVRLADPDVPITIYSEAVAAGAYTGTVSVRDWEGGGGGGHCGGIHRHWYAYCRVPAEHVPGCFFDQNHTISTSTPDTLQGTRCMSQAAPFNNFTLLTRPHLTPYRAPAACPKPRLSTSSQTSASQ